MGKRFFVVVINGNDGNAETFRIGELVMEHCTSYVYLGSLLTCDGSLASAVKIHAKNNYVMC